jgi:hypothetical protein
MVHTLNADRSQKVMADSHPFRFLDLPKELRLMVYELLPIKTTFHVFHHDGSFVGATLQLVWKTLSGINVLATCHEINFEAKAILGPVLDQLKQEPISLVASAENLCTTTVQGHFINCVSLSEINCKYNHDPRSLTLRETYCDYSHFDKHNNLPATGAPARHVHIATKCSFEGIFDTSAQRINFFTSCLLAFQEPVYRLIDGPGVTGRTLHVRVRPALLSVEDKTELQNAAPSELYDTTWEPDLQLRSFVHLGDSIEVQEWEEDWAEGERQC